MKWNKHRERARKPVIEGERWWVRVRNIFSTAWKYSNFGLIEYLIETCFEVSLSLYECMMFETQILVSFHLVRVRFSTSSCKYFGNLWNF